MGFHLQYQKLQKKVFKYGLFHTLLRNKFIIIKKNDLVNIEIDILSKYVRNYFNEKNNFTSIENIINVAKKGGMFILVDDEKRENEGDLIISTSDSNAKNINFMAKYGRGLICLAID